MIDLCRLVLVQVQAARQFALYLASDSAGSYLIGLTFVNV